MIINLCDFCGEPTKAGKNQEFLAVTITPRRTKAWRKDGNDGTRFGRVKLNIGIDGCNPEMEHPGHDLCTTCRILLIEGVLERLREAEHG